VTSTTAWPTVLKTVLATVCAGVPGALAGWGASSDCLGALWRLPLLGCTMPATPPPAVPPASASATSAAVPTRRALRGLARTGQVERRAARHAAKRTDMGALRILLSILWGHPREDRLGDPDRMDLVRIRHA
jgi:hypothetical protein